MPTFFCTVGFGVDKFAVKELTSLFPDVIIDQVLIGKVFFTTQYTSDLLQLKTVERLFVEVIHCSTTDIPLSTLDTWLGNKLSSADLQLAAWKQLTGHSSIQIKFRVNPRLSGRFRQPALFHHIASLSSSALATRDDLHLTVDLQEPELEVFLHLNDNYLTVGLPVSKRPLSDRPYIKHIAVRSTVCCALCAAVDLTSKDVLLDPMCGAATILVEAVRRFDCRAAFGVDNNPSQLEIAQQNLEASSTKDRIHLISADSSSSSWLRGSHFDVVLCDVPFGRKFGRPEQIQALLSDVVKTIDSALKPNGRVGILIR